MSTSEDYNVSQSAFIEGDKELWRRIFEAFKDVRSSTRRLLAEDPSEARLMFYLLVSDLFFFVSWSLKSFVFPTASVVERFPMEMVYWLVIAVLFRTALMYAFSIAIGGAARLLGGSGTWRQTRAAVFWGALVAAPFGLAMSAVALGLGAFEGAVPQLAQPLAVLLPAVFGLLPFVWYIAEAVAQAHGLKRHSGGFYAVAFVCTLGAAFAIYFKAQGVL